MSTFIDIDTDIYWSPMLFWQVFTNDERAKADTECRARLRKFGVAHYHVHERYTIGDDEPTTYHRAVYEVPVFMNVALFEHYRMFSGDTRVHIARPLMFQGQAMAGVLIDGILYLTEFDKQSAKV